MLRKIKICPKCNKKLMLKRVNPVVNGETIFRDAYICTNNKCEGGVFK